MMHKKACKQFAEDKQAKDMDYWNHVMLYLLQLWVIMSELQDTNLQLQEILRVVK